MKIETSASDLIAMNGDKTIQSLDQSDIEMGRRLRSIRGDLSQRELADAIGIKKTRYASYEYGRVLLRFEVAMKICKILNISQLWLQSGQGNKQGFIPLDLARFQRIINDRTTFKDGYKLVQKLLESPAQEPDGKDGKHGGLSVDLTPATPLPNISTPAPNQLDQDPTEFKIHVGAEEQNCGIVTVVTPAWAVDPAIIIQLKHPGYPAIKRILHSHKNDGSSVIEYQILMNCLPPDQANEEFLRKMSPYFVMALEAAAQKLVAVRPRDNEFPPST